MRISSNLNLLNPFLPVGGILHLPKMGCLLTQAEMIPRSLAPHLIQIMLAKEENG